MTEPTPDPDDPGEGLRTRPASGKRAQVNSAWSNGARRTGTLDTVAREERTPTNGAHGLHHGKRNGAPNGTHNGAHAGTTAPAVIAYAEAGHNDNMDVDAASLGTAPGNGALGEQALAGTEPLPLTGTNGHATNSQVAKGHVANGQTPNGQAPNGQAPTAQGPNGQTRNGQGPNGQRVNGHTVSRQFGPRRATVAQTDNGHAGNGRVTRDPIDVAGESDGVASDVVDLSGGELTRGDRGGESVTFGFGETAGVLPGDQRTFDDVEAGIVALWRQFGERREQPLRDRLVLHYAPLVKYVAGRVGTGLPAHVEVADLIQSGIFGLVDAIEKFEPERGLKFETYAMQRIRGAILDDLRAQDWVPRSVRGRAREVERALERLGAQLRRTPTDGELADELGLSLHELRDVYAQLQLTSVVALDELAAAGRGPTPLADILEDQEALDPVALLVDQDNRRQLAQAIAHLAERDRVVVTLYYFENLTLAEIGRVLGVTESRVCQLHTRAVLRLRAKLLEKTDT
jgi:RNA polymerase sigma factor for flagellar operon FliA